MEGNTSMNSASISHLGICASDEDASPSPTAAAGNTTAHNANTASAVGVASAAPEKAVVDPSAFSCEGYEIHEETAELGATSSFAARNPRFDIAAQPLETQFNWIEKEFAAIEGRTMNPRQYNFATSFAFPTKNRYINVMANEETIFPSPKSPRAMRSSAQTPRTTGQRILNTLRGSSPAASEASTATGENVASFRCNSVTASGKNVPLYFNGNVVDLGVSPVFVAAQAPVLDCMEDFLNAVYNYAIPLILMLTEVEEGGFVKAERYWPADRAGGLAEEVFGNMVAYKDPEDPYTVDEAHELIRRPFFIRPCNAPREMAYKVVMVQYVGWPDRGVPDSTESFEELLRIISHHAAQLEAAETEKGKEEEEAPEESSSRPTPSVLVHCSAGIGRTGTLIGAYAAIQWMRAGRLQRDSIPTILLEMRRARFGMVQRVEQYMFLYLIVLQHLGVDTTSFIARMQPRADQYNFRWMEARQAAMAARASRQQQQ